MKTGQGSNVFDIQLTSFREANMRFRLTLLLLSLSLTTTSIGATSWIERQLGSIDKLELSASVHDTCAEPYISNEGIMSAIQVRLSREFGTCQRL